MDKKGYKKRCKLPSNWRSRLELVHHDTNKHEGEFILRFKKGKTPKGFMSQIGNIEYYQSGLYVFVGPELDPYFRGRKLGLLLYETVLEKFGTLSTIYHSASDEAKRVWQSLIRKYPHETDFWSDRLTVKKVQK